ncbi:MAG: cytochrome c family protein [Pseudomonadota bacterium]
MSFLFIGASALTLAACGGGGGTESAEETTATIEDVTTVVAEAADDTVETASAAADSAEDMVDSATDTAADAADAVEDTAADAMDTVEDTATDAMDATEEVATDAMDTAGDMIDGATDAVEDAAEDVVEDVTEAATDAAESSGALDIATAAGVAADKVSADTVSAYQALTGDPAAGRRVFTKCMSCHVVAEGQNRVGPSLYGIIGREAGSIEGFRYSSANSDSGITWTEPVMFAYLEKPQEFIRGTTMAFPGLPSAQERVDVIAYIKQESGQ